MILVADLPDLPCENHVANHPHGMAASRVPKWRQLGPGSPTALGTDRRFTRAVIGDSGDGPGAIRDVIGQAGMTHGSGVPRLALSGNTLRSTDLTDSTGWGTGRPFCRQARVLPMLNSLPACREIVGSARQGGSVIAPQKGA